MAITWNIVNRTGQPLEAAEDSLRGSITRLEKLLAHFPDDALHLQIVFSPQRRNRSHPVSFNLRVPSDVLQVRKEAPTQARAVKDAVGALANRLERLKSRYRRDHVWKRRRTQSMPERAATFAENPLVEGTIPQTFKDMVTRILKDDYERLLGFVRRQLNEYVLNGAVPRGAIDAKDIVHCVAEKALSDSDFKPESTDYYTWCTSLAFQQTRDAVRDFIDAEGRELSVDLDVDLDLGENAQEGVEPEEFALNLLRQKLEPDECTLADTLPDSHSEAPDVRLFEREVVSGMRKMARTWPTFERQIFEMYFLEGMSTDDLATTFECDRGRVDRTLELIRARLRTRLTAAATGQEAMDAFVSETDESPAAMTSKGDLDPGRARQRDVAATRTRLEFDALRIAMHRLESSLASAAPHREEPWTRRVRDDFRAVHAALRRHGESTGLQDGLFAELRIARPDVEPRIRDLARRQEEMMELAARLEETIAGDSDTPDFGSIRRQAADLLFMIRRQHAREVDLIYETFWQDIGGSE